MLHIGLRCNKIEFLYFSSLRSLYLEFTVLSLRCYNTVVYGYSVLRFTFTVAFTVRGYGVQVYGPIPWVYGATGRRSITVLYSSLRCLNLTVQSYGAEFHGAIKIGYIAHTPFQRCSSVRCSTCLAHHQLACYIDLWLYIRLHKLGFFITFLAHLCMKPSFRLKLYIFSVLIGLRPFITPVPPYIH